jgi:hypothetical protein
VSGRNPKYQEFLQTLSDVTGLTGAAFARACGKAPTNMSSYLRGSKRVTQNTARSAIANLRDVWRVTPVLEVEPIPRPLTGLTTQPGIYVLYGSSGDVLYVGQATNLRTEVAQTLNRRVNFTLRRGPRISVKAHPRYREVAVRMTAYIVEPPKLRHNLEALLLRVYLNEAHNNKMGVFR